MMRRMSKRLAARAAWASSSMPSSSSPAGPRKGICLSSDMSLLLDEDDVQDDDQHERATGQEVRRSPPQAVARVGVLLGVLLLAREAPDQAAQLLLGLGLRHERHGDGDDRVGQEGDDRAPEARRQFGPEVDDALGVQDVRDERAQE